MLRALCLRRLSVHLQTVRPFTTPTHTNSLQITQRCAERINELSRQRNKHVVLRVQVDGGGCSGFQYGFVLEDWDQQPQPSQFTDKHDILLEHDGAHVIVDDVSLAYVSGSTLDYVQELISSSFRVTNNPNSEASCGCGVSFSPKA